MSVHLEFNNTGIEPVETFQSSFKLQQLRLISESGCQILKDNGIHTSLINRNFEIAEKPTVGFIGLIPSLNSAK